MFDSRYRIDNRYDKLYIGAQVLLCVYSAVWQDISDASGPLIVCLVFKVIDSIGQCYLHRSIIFCSYLNAIEYRFLLTDKVHGIYFKSLCGIFFLVRERLQSDAEIIIHLQYNYSG